MWGGISSSELSSGSGSWCRAAAWPSSAHPPMGTRADLTTFPPAPKESEKQKDIDSIGEKSLQLTQICIAYVQLLHCKLSLVDLKNMKYSYSSYTKPVQCFLS